MFKLVWITFLFPLFLHQVAAASSAPDLILYHAKVFTSDEGHLWAEAIAIKGERICAVGADQEVLSTAGPQTRRIDTGGRVIVAGFNDAHIHSGKDLPSYPLRFSSPDPSWGEVVNTLASVIDHAPTTEIIRVAIWRTAWEDTRANRESLDRVAPHRAVVLQTPDGHSAVMNSAYMRRLGIRDDEPDPPLGSYDRTPGSSRLTGRVAEYARWSIARKEDVLARNPNDTADLAADVKEFLKNGLTSIQDMNWGGAAHSAHLWLESKLPLRVREIFWPFASTTCGDDPLVRQAVPPLSQNISMGGCKWILDGVEPLLTNAVNQPYAGLPGRTGVLTFSDTQVAEMIRSAEAQHQQLLFHAGGGRAVEQLLRALESRPDIDWPSRRVRLEHGDGIEPGQMDRIARLGVIVVQNPAHLGVPPTVPVEIARTSFPQPLQTLLKHHIRLALGSDGPWNPFTNLQRATAIQWHPQESLTREQAVIAYTYGSSFAEFREQEKGRLLPGQWADLAVLSKDIFTVPAKQLPSTDSVLTMIGGQIVHDAKVLAVPPAPSQ